MKATRALNYQLRMNRGGGNEMDGNGWEVGMAKGGAVEKETTENKYNRKQQNWNKSCLGASAGKQLISFSLD